MLVFVVFALHFVAVKSARHVSEYEEEVLSAGPIPYDHITYLQQACHVGGEVVDIDMDKVMRRPGALCKQVTGRCEDWFVVDKTGTLRRCTTNTTLTQKSAGCHKHASPCTVMPKCFKTADFSIWEQSLSDTRQGAYKGLSSKNPCCDPKAHWRKQLYLKSRTKYSPKYSMGCSSVPGGPDPDLD
eukprot:TRINITY_DN28701_c0_g1_i1.p1 TRINITY_DN28701_c0_g1~~TRINITY_DN28701_c0_g1_i1.p1  ORF type:complete len:185 (-),score=17.84 TRINITY_DN28701_c0_g1_i1:129-683(-)